VGLQRLARSVYWRSTMETIEIMDIIRQCRYKPDWFFNFNPQPAYLQISVINGTCSRTGSVVNWKGAKHHISKHMCKQEIVGLVWKAVQEAETHEMREWFRYRKQAIFSPHLDPDSLVEMCRKGGCINVRKNAMSMEEV
jgi:hypothetical protein